MVLKIDVFLVIKFFVRKSKKNLEGGEKNQKIGIIYTPKNKFHLFFEVNF